MMERTVVGLLPAALPDMPEKTRHILLSSVTREFGDHRRMLKHDLELPRVKVHEQQDFVRGGGTQLQKLDAYIRECDAVVHLVGAEVGDTLTADEVAWLRRTYADFDTVFPFLSPDLSANPPVTSYTQIEAWLALRHGKRCHLYRPAEIASDALPPDHPQERHWQNLKRRGEDRGTFHDAQHLCRLVLRDLNDLWPEDVPGRRPIRLPFPSLGARFKGRENVLVQLRGAHSREGSRSAAAVGKAVHGLGGVGKTRLAVEYAWQQADHYSALLFVTADTVEALERNLADLVGPMVLDLPEKEATEQDARVAAVLRWLNSHRKWLLILDNVDSEPVAERVERLLGELAGGEVLITSRLGRWSGCVEALELDVLPEEAAAELLLEHTRTREDRAAERARELAGLLGCLALAIVQAAAYVRQKRLTLGDYLDRWRGGDQRVQDWYDSRTMQYPRSVATTWQTTLDQLGPCDVALLNVLAWFSPEPIPLSLFGRAEIARILADFIQGDVREALVHLADYSMIGWEAAHGTITVHRLVQEILRARQGDSQRTYLAIALQVLDAARPSESPDDVFTWPAWEPLRPHVRDAAREGDRLGIPHPTSMLMDALATLAWAKALHAEAEELEGRALAIEEQAYGGEHPAVALSLDNLANFLRETNRLAEAEPLMRRALAIDEASHGPGHPTVARRLTNLAKLLAQTSRQAEAEPLLRRAVAIDEAAFGPEDAQVAIDLCNLASLLRAANRVVDAEGLMRRAVDVLAAFRAFNGHEHPEAGRIVELYRVLTVERLDEEAEGRRRDSTESNGAGRRSG